MITKKIQPSEDIEFYITIGLDSTEETVPSVHVAATAPKIENEISLRKNKNFMVFFAMDSKLPSMVMYVSRLAQINSIDLVKKASETHFTQGSSYIFSWIKRVYI